METSITQLMNEVVKIKKLMKMKLNKPGNVIQQLYEERYFSFLFIFYISSFYKSPIK